VESGEAEGVTRAAGLNRRLLTSLVKYHRKPFVWLCGYGVDVADPDLVEERLVADAAYAVPSVRGLAKERSFQAI